MENCHHVPWVGDLKEFFGILSLLAIRLCCKIQDVCPKYVSVWKTKNTIRNYVISYTFSSKSASQAGTSCIFIIYYTCRPADLSSWRHAMFPCLVANPGLPHRRMPSLSGWAPLHQWPRLKKWRFGGRICHQKSLGSWNGDIFERNIYEHPKILLFFWGTPICILVPSSILNDLRIAGRHFSFWTANTHSWRGGFRGGQISCEFGRWMMGSEAYQRCRQSVGETNHALRAFEPFSNECDLVDYFFFRDLWAEELSGGF